MRWNVDLAAGILLRLEKSGLTREGVEGAFPKSDAEEVARNLSLLADQGLLEVAEPHTGAESGQSDPIFALTFKGMMFVDQAQKAPWLADVRDRAPTRGIDLAHAAVRYSLEHLLLEQGGKDS